MESTLRLLIFAFGFLIILGIYVDGRKRKHAARHPKNQKKSGPLTVHNRMERFDSPQETQATEGEPDFELPDTPKEDISIAVPSFQPALISVSIVAKNGSVFKGRDILDGLSLVGLEFDLKRCVFVRYEQGNPKLGVQFTAVQIVEPGIFSLADLPFSEFPGISLFMTLPGPRSPMHAYEEMLRIAKIICARLRGEVIGNDRQLLSNEEVMATSQKIREFEDSSLKKTG